MNTRFNFILGFFKLIKLLRSVKPYSTLEQVLQSQSKIGGIKHLVEHNQMKVIQYLQFQNILNETINCKTYAPFFVRVFDEFSFKE